MKIKPQNARLLTTAAHSSQFPETTEKEIVFVGKSNVGKSTIINSLSNRKRLAYVGRTPGKTRLANFFQINDDIIFVDVPGYGFANRSKEEQVAFGELMDDYFAKRDISLMLILVDIRRGISEDDLMMVQYASFYAIPFGIVLSKADKLSRNKANQAVNKIKNELPYDVLLFSEKDQNLKSQLETYIMDRV